MTFPEIVGPHPRSGAMPGGELLAALAEHGAVLLRSPEVPAGLLQQALADARAFFALPVAARTAVAIERSPHFRGYSVQHNERDYREQVHFGREVPAAGERPPWLLEGPNQWPANDAWRERVLAYLDTVATFGCSVLAAITGALGLPAAAVPVADPYVLLKMICYHAQPRGTPPRAGVAAHVDFSWLTLTLQDDVGGLEVRDRRGRWQAVTPTPGTLLLHTGELLQFVSGNGLPAAPHRVVNPSRAVDRFSLPLFLNPGLAAFVPAPVASVPLPPDAEHVHRVLPLDARGPGFCFGEAEWRRKGEGHWCAVCTRGD